MLSRSVKSKVKKKMKSSNTIGTNNGKPNAQRGVPYLPDYITPYWLSLIPDFPTYPFFTPDLALQLKFSGH
jgi:hypothetical protein